MKRAILLLVVVVGGAFYLGWFTFTTRGTGSSEQIDIVIDKNKVHEAEIEAFDKLNEYEQQLNHQAEKSAASTGASAAPGSSLR